MTEEELRRYDTAIRLEMAMNYLCHAEGIINRTPAIDADGVRGALELVRGRCRTALSVTKAEIGAV
ncbi:MAG TPA: hypothetical protein VHS58_00140 [Acetobacteraceae bacterium]|nr:hypothetical protein [Acetobacteraceae bacterium]